MKDGETTRVSFTYTFEAEGTYKVTVTGEASYGGYTYEQSASDTISVEAPDSGEVTATASTPSSPTQELTGAFFPVPTGLQDDVQTYRDKTSGVAPHAFIIATEDAAYIAFSDSPVTKGAGTVRGRVVSKQIATAGGVSFGAMVVTNVDPQTKPREVGVRSLAKNPGKYALDLVETQGTHTVTASLYQPESGSGVESPTTLGVVTSGEPFPQNLTRGAATAVFNASAVTLPTSGDRVYTTSTRTAFWASTQARVQGVVLPPGSVGRKVAALGPTGNVLTQTKGHTVVSLTKTASAAKQMESVRDVKSGDVTGEMVQFKANLVQTRVSTQELLTQTTPCGETKVPVKEVCVPVPNDVLLHTGVAWDAGATKTKHAIGIVGASSRMQDQIVTAARGQYRITGRVVSLQQIDSRLADRRVVVVTNLTRVGKLNADVPEAMVSLRDRLNQSVTSHVSVNASTSAEAAARAVAGSDGESGQQATPTQSDGKGNGSGGGMFPKPQSQPGFSPLSAAMAIIVLAAVRACRSA